MIGTLAPPWTTMAFYRMPDQTFNATMRETDDDFPQGPQSWENGVFRETVLGPTPFAFDGPLIKDGGAIGSALVPPPDHYAAQEGKEVPCIVYVPGGRIYEEAGGLIAKTANKYGGWTSSQSQGVANPVKGATFAHSYKTSYLDPTFLEEDGVTVAGGPTRDTGISALMIIIGGPPNGQGGTAPITTMADDSTFTSVGSRSDVTPPSPSLGSSVVMIGTGGIGGQGEREDGDTEGGGGGGGAGWNHYNFAMDRAHNGFGGYANGSGTVTTTGFGWSLTGDLTELQETGNGWHGAQGGKPGNLRFTSPSANRNANFGQPGVKFLLPGEVFGSLPPALGGLGATEGEDKNPGGGAFRFNPDPPAGSSDDIVADPGQSGGSAITLGYADYVWNADLATLCSQVLGVGRLASYNKIHHAPDKTYIVNNGLLAGGGAGGAGGNSDVDRSTRDWADRGFSGGQLGSLAGTRHDMTGPNGEDVEGGFAGSAVRVGDHGVHDASSVVFLAGGLPFNTVNHTANLDGASRCIGGVEDAVPE